MVSSLRACYQTSQWLQTQLAPAIQITAANTVNQRESYGPNSETNRQRISTKIEGTKARTTHLGQSNLQSVNTVTSPSFYGIGKGGTMDDRYHLAR